MCLEGRLREGSRARKKVTDWGIGISAMQAPRTGPPLVLVWDKRDEEGGVEPGQLQRRPEKRMRALAAPREKLGRDGPISLPHPF